MVYLSAPLTLLYAGINPVSISATEPDTVMKESVSVTKEEGVMIVLSNVTNLVTIATENQKKIVQVVHKDMD